MSLRKAMDSLSRASGAVWKAFDKVFAELNKELDEIGGEVEEGTEKETIRTEARPDGTTVVTKTVVRKISK